MKGWEGCGNTAHSHSPPLDSLHLPPLTGRPEPQPQPPPLPPHPTAIHPTSDWPSPLPLTPAAAAAADEQRALAAVTAAADIDIDIDADRLIGSATEASADQQRLLDAAPDAQMQRLGMGMGGAMRNYSPSPANSNGGLFTTKSGAIDRQKLALVLICSALALWVVYDAY